MNAELYALAQAAISDSGDDRASAVESLMKRIRCDEGLIGAVIAEAAETAIGYAYRVDRRAIWTGTANPPAASTEALSAGGDAIMSRSLLDYPLASGRRLADAARPEIRENADISYRNMIGNRVRYLWLTLVAERLPDDEVKCREVLGAAELEEMQKTAERAAARRRS